MMRTDPGRLSDRRPLRAYKEHNGTMIPKNVADVAQGERGVRPDLGPRLILGRLVQDQHPLTREPSDFEIGHKTTVLALDHPAGCNFPPEGAFRRQLTFANIVGCDRRHYQPTQISKIARPYAMGAEAHICRPVPATRLYDKSATAKMLGTFDYLSRPATDVDTGLAGERECRPPLPSKGRQAGRGSVAMLPAPAPPGQMALAPLSSRCSPRGRVAGVACNRSI